MKLISQADRSISGRILGVMILAIYVPIVYLHSAEDTVVSHILTNNLTALRFLASPSNDEIQLKNIEKEVEQFEVILIPHGNRYKRETISAPIISSSNSSEYENIENEIKIIQGQLSILANSTSLITEDKLKINALESKMINLQKSLEALKADLKVKDEMNAKNLQDVFQTLETVVTNSVAQNILMSQFSFAEIQLQSTSDAILRKVFKTIYNQQTDNNFDLITTTADSFKNFELKIKVYETLYEEMKSNNNTSSEKLLLLTQHLKTILTKNSTDVVASKTKSLICNLWNENHRSAVEVISAAYFDNSIIHTMAKQHSADIFLHCDYTNRYKNMSDIYKKVIENVSDKVNTRDILNYAFCNLRPDTNIAESAALNEAAFDKLENVDKLYTNDVIPLARHVKKVMENSNYRDLDSEFREGHEDIKSNLPISVKNLVFSSAVCLKNGVHNEYLYAGTNQELLDSDRRLVFTWIPQTRNDSTFKWRANFRDDYEIQLINADLNEYLFAHGGNLFDHRRRYVLTWRRERGDYIKDSTWNLEVADTDAIRIKNKYYNEYLYTDGYEKQDQERRHVFTFTTGKKTYDSEWEVIDCSE